MESIDAIKNCIAIQKDCLTDNYMVGLYNGLELARATIENDEPNYQDTFSTPKGSGVDKLVKQKGKTMNKKLLEDIRHELVTLDNLIATDKEECFVLDVSFRIHTTDTIKRIDEELSKPEDKIIVELKEALIWCSGSADFGEGGQARVGWLKICQPLLK